MWFLFMMPGLYLFTPSLRSFLRSADTSGRVRVVAIMLTLATLHSAVAAWQCSAWPTVFTMFIPYLGYYVCGYHLRTTSTARLPMTVLLAAGLACTMVIVAGTGALVPHYGWRRGAFLHEFLSLPVICVSIAVFAAFSKLRHAGGPAVATFARWCRLVAPSTLGIYLCHPLLLRLAERHRQGLTTSGRAIVGVPVVAVLVFAGSLAAVTVVMRVPYLRGVVS